MIEQKWLSVFLGAFFAFQVYNVSTASYIGTKDKFPSNVAIPDYTGTPPTFSPSTMTQPKFTANGTVKTGIGCGVRTVRPNEVLQINTLNFGFANYFNKDACEWKFLSQYCDLSMECPCFDIVPSFECLGDYLKISDAKSFHQRFCGDTIPYGRYRSGSDQLIVKFKTNFRDTATGFLCYVYCTPVGLAEQMRPNNITAYCPTPLTRF